MPPRFKIPIRPKPDPVPLTQAAYDELVSDKDRLEIELKAVNQRILVAREMGDLSENGAYHYGKFERGNIRRKLNQIYFLLEHGVVTAASASGVIGFGTLVTVQLLDENDQPVEGQTKSFLLVSQHESNPEADKLSLESPLGQAVMGKKIGDVVEVATPRGTKRWRIG